MSAHAPGTDSISQRLFDGTYSARMPIVRHESQSVPSDCRQPVILIPLASTVSGPYPSSRTCYDSAPGSFPHHFRQSPILAHIHFHSRSYPSTHNSCAHSPQQNHLIQFTKCTSPCILQRSRLHSQFGKKGAPNKRGRVDHEWPAQRPRVGPLPPCLSPSPPRREILAPVLCPRLRFPRSLRHAHSTVPRALAGQFALTETLRQLVPHLPSQPQRGGPAQQLHSAEPIAPRAGPSP